MAEPLPPNSAPLPWPSPPAGPNSALESFGSELVTALLAFPSSSSSSSGLPASCRAAAILQHLLTDNLQSKQRVLSIPLELAGGQGTDYLLPRC